MENADFAGRVAVEREERLHLYQEQKPYRDRLDGSKYSSLPTN
jgi:hypothetical protein